MDSFTTEHQDGCNNSLSVQDGSSLAAQVQWLCKVYICVKWGWDGETEVGGRAGAKVISVQAAVFWKCPLEILVLLS